MGDNGYDSLSLYQLDENMEVSLVRTYTAGEGECFAARMYDNRKWIYVLQSADATENGTLKYTFFSGSLEKRVTVENVVNIGYTGRSEIFISVKDGDKIRKYRLDTESMELTEMKTGE